MLQNELNAAFDNGERILASELPFEWKPPTLASDELTRVGRWLAWAREKCVRACPAKPSSVAAFVVHEHALGTPAQQIISLLEAIAKFHDHHNASCPCATSIVRTALDEIVIGVEAPRSWSKEEKIEWALLPPDIREVVARREQQRDTALRRKQNKLAEEKKRLATEAAASSVNIEKEHQANATLYE
jgi:hypothetical protein